MLDSIYHMINRSNIRALVLMNLLNTLRNILKCSANLAFYLFSPARLNKSLKHARSCKILYHMTLVEPTVFPLAMAYTGC